MTLPVVLTKIQDLILMQNRWKSILDKLLTNPSLQSNILKDVQLAIGLNVVNHLLDRNLIGWRIIGINAPATIFDSQANNQTPQTTLILNSNAKVMISLEVF